MRKTVTYILFIFMFVSATWAVDQNLQTLSKKGELAYLSLTDKNIPAYASVLKWEPRISKTLRSICLNHWKLIVDYESEIDSLYDLTLDPSEKVNLAAYNPEKVAELKSLLRTYYKQSRARFVAGDAVKRNKRIVQELKSLGYLITED